MDGDTMHPIKGILVRRSVDVNFLSVMIGTLITVLALLTQQTSTYHIIIII